MMMCVIAAVGFQIGSWKLSPCTAFILMSAVFECL